MKFVVRDESIRGIRHLFTREPQPDIPIWRVVRLDDGTVMETYRTRAEAERSAARLNSDLSDISIETALRSDAEND